ncbi:caspase-9 isoform X1 [Hemiscyllium ocellatum]|uniref:caspase-9 isoform X1 n=1 Tax=Hemiscyllium ocellatum TaxID=170820 RepID=UPI0029677431|nr:caspase-9 isoform X1 [Hemiscyllium ocellatum]
MNQHHRKLLQRNRIQLVIKLQPELIYDFLTEKGVFTDDMIEEVKKSGTRRDQARQLVTDLQTRGTGAFYAFLESLKESKQYELFDLLQEGLSIQNNPSIFVRPVQPMKVYNPVQQDTRISHPVQCSDVDIGLGKPTTKGLQDDMIYKMDADPCGLCLIINNVDFFPSSGLTCRSGSDIDCENVENLFKKLRFEVIVKRNLTKHVMVKELKNLALKDHTVFDSCVIVILSHGSQAQHRQFPGAIFGVDGGQSLPVQHIVSYFDGSHCPTLREKPKLFFIQACGGDLKDKGFKTAEEVDSIPTILFDSVSLQTDATPCPAEDEPDAVSSLPTPSDILVSYSTFPGYVSWRDKKDGSWYMKTLVNIFSKYAHSDDLQILLTRVTRSISENEEAKGVYKQIPGSFNFLRKQLYFYNKEKQ